jgi:hypothetical protein
MAHLYRLGAWLLLAATLAMLWTPAQAAFAPFPQVVSYRVGQDGNPPYYPSPAAACNAVAAGQGATYFGTITSTFEFPHPAQAAAACLISNHEGPKSNHGIYYNLGPASCPAGSTLSGGQCVCNAPKVQNATNNGCQDPTPVCGPLGTPVPGTSSANQYAGSAGYTGGLLCNAGCKTYPSSSWRAQDGKWYATGPLTYVGSSSFCALTPAPGGNDTPTVQPPPVTCGTGKCPGTVNGLDVCMPCQSGTTESTTDEDKTADAPTGGASAPGSSDPDYEPPGSSSGTGTTKTTCTGTSCTTTTTTTKTGTDGNTQTVTSTKTEPKDDYCTRNPRSALCITSQFGGSCDGGFTFEGDAIQGAIAKEIHAQNCLLNRPNDESTLYDQEKNKTGNQTTDLPGNDTVNVGSNSFDQSNALTAGPACIGNKSVTVMGTTVNLPFSGICPWLENLGYVLMAISALLSARIVTRG